MDIPEKIYAKFRRKARYLGRDIGYLLGAHERFFREARGSRMVIYHGICLSDHTRFNPIFLTWSLFEEQLKLYKKYCNVVSLDDFYQKKFSDDRFNICLTFDDGFANNYTYVLPLLEKYQLPASFFVTAIRDGGYDILWDDFLGIVSKYGPKNIKYDNEQYHKGLFDKYTSDLTGITLNQKLRAAGFDKKAAAMEQLYPLVPFKNTPAEEDYWLQMTKEQIRELAQSPFVTIGAHGYYHNDLSKISLRDAVSELARSKQFLETLIEKEVTSFAFPYGTYTREVAEAAKKTGYTQLLAMDFHFNEDSSDAAMCERFTVNPFISPANQLYATINRQYEQ